MRSLLYLLGILLCCTWASALAQPTIDLNFQPSAIYQPARITAVLQLSSGARMVAGTILQADGQPANNVVRYQPNGTPDATFAANVSLYQWAPTVLTEAPGGKVLVLNERNSSALAPPTTGPSSAPLLRLNADGTLDTTFSLTTSLSGTIYTMLVQPDGKVVIGGQFSLTSAPGVRNLVRLNTDGTPDASFVAAGNTPNNNVYALALQPDGKLLVGGRFSTLNGLPVPLLARLLPDGSLDVNFGIRATPGSASEVETIALQAGGRIVVGGVTPLSSSPNGLVRITATGAFDPTFQSPTITSPQMVQVLANDQLLVKEFNRSSLRRLQPNGTPDPTFNMPARVDTEAWQALSNGQVLLGSQFTFFAGPAFQLSALLLSATGVPDLSFAPHLQGPGQVADIAVQADGRILLAGNFDEVNGTAAHGLARLNADGTVDATYAPQAPIGTSIGTLALQPDGKLLVGGAFVSLGGSARPGLARLLPGGAADASFVPTGFPANTVYQLARQSTGEVVARINGGALIRFLPTGQLDPTFAIPAGTVVQAFMVQPDDHVVIAGEYQQAGANYSVARLLPTGALDPSFNLNASPGRPLITTLALYPDGRLLVGGFLRQYGSIMVNNIVRLFADGNLDASFVSFSNSIFVNSLAVQPNQRVLVGGDVVGLISGSLTLAGTERLLSDGTLDPSYSSIQGPATSVTKVTIQPDGKILAAGNFSTVSGLGITGLTRLVDPNVLSVPPTTRAATLTAWPVPAREALHVQLDAAAQPQRVQLLDALGRAVLTQAATGPTLTLPTAELAPGVYVLRVEYATGAASRRVVLE